MVDSMKWFAVSYLAKHVFNEPYDDFGDWSAIQEYGLSFRQEIVVVQLFRSLFKIAFSNNFENVSTSGAIAGCLCR